jgi:NAD(P)-dependent dehydrogenase (short-subunit alcohol dehydrogenase family)
MFHPAGCVDRIAGPAPDRSDYGSTMTVRGPALTDETVVVIGGSAGIGMETARLAQLEGARVVLAARNRERLEAAADELGAWRSSALDARDPGAIERFFREFADPIDHVMVTAGAPYYAPLADIDLDEAALALQDHPLLMVSVARQALHSVRHGGSLTFMGGTGARHPSVGIGLSSAMTAALPALAASLAVEVAPVRVNLIAAGFVDTPLSADLLGDALEARRDELRRTLPIGRVVSPVDVAALAVHIMSNGALTGATFDIDGGQQLVAGPR